MKVRPRRPLISVTLSILGLAALAGRGPQGSTVEPASSAPPSPVAMTGCAPTTANILHSDAFAFDRRCMAVPARVATTIDYWNDDEGETHNVSIYPLSSCLGAAVDAHRTMSCTDPFAEAVFRGGILFGPSRITYEVPALAPGDYVFVCDVHLWMAGRINVG